jgi:hypothetical protein
MFFFACAGAASAWAETSLRPLSDVFVRFCGDTGGDADSALERADAESWALPPPKALTPVPFGSGTWTDLRGRWSRAEGVLRVVEVGTIHHPDGKTALVCTVAETPPHGVRADFDAIERALKHWVGGPPMKASEGFAIFAYRLDGAQRIVLDAAQNPLENDTVLTRADTTLVSLVNVFGITPTITYMRWR